MFRAQCSRWLLFGALVLAPVRMVAALAAGRDPDPAPTASGPRFTTAVVSSVRQTADRTSEAAQIAAAMVGLGLIDRVRREAGMV